MRHALIALLLLAGLCGAREPTRPTNCTATHYTIIVRKADSTFATDTYVPSVYNAGTLTGVWVANMDGDTLPKDTTSGNDSLPVWFRDPAINSTTGGDSVVVWDGASRAQGDTTGVYADAWGGSNTLSLVLHLDGDATDAGPTGNDGTAYNSPTWLAGAVGRGVDLDGTDQWIGVPHNANLAGGDGTNDNALTVLSAVSMDDATTFYMVCKGTDGFSLDYRFITANDDLLYGQIYDGVGGVRRSRSWSSAVTGSQGNWRMAAFSYDGCGGANAADGIDIYWQGAVVDDNSNNAGSYAAMHGESSLLRIGNWVDDYADGTIDEVWVGQFELSEGQVHNWSANVASFSTNGVWTVGERRPYLAPKQKFRRGFGFGF